MIKQFANGEEAERIGVITQENAFARVFERSAEAVSPQFGETGATRFLESLRELAQQTEIGFAASARVGPGLHGAAGRTAHRRFGRRFDHSG
jgi:hypothetical protein